jgi:threonine/homoserine/homoserine lactone efflux protein
MSIETFPGTATLVAFAAASLLLAITPGPGVFYVVARTLAHGRRAGLASVAGVALGNLGNAAAASIGLAALLAVSALAFTVVKLAGAAYLVWLAVQALRAGSEAARAVGRPDAIRQRRLFRDGFLVALLNPKTALFFAAFLPQFIDPAGSTIAQSLGFGAGFVGIAATTDTFYVLLAGAVAPRFATARGLAAGRWLLAGAYLGLAAWTLTAGPRHKV